MRRVIFALVVALPLSWSFTGFAQEEKAAPSTEEAPPVKKVSKKKSKKKPVNPVKQEGKQEKAVPEENGGESAETM